MRLPTTIFISRPIASGREVCKPDQINCMDGVVPPGDGSANADSQDVEHDIGPVDVPHGAHRFIGVIAVVVLILLAFLLWLGFRTWLGRKIQILFYGKSNSAPDGEKKSNIVNGVVENDTGGSAKNNLPDKSNSLKVRTAIDSESMRSASTFQDPQILQVPIHA